MSSLAAPGHPEGLPGAGARSLGGGGAWPQPCPHPCRAVRPSARPSRGLPRCPHPTPVRGPPSPLPVRVSGCLCEWGDWTGGPPPPPRCPGHCGQCGRRAEPRRAICRHRSVPGGHQGSASLTLLGCPLPRAQAEGWPRGHSPCQAEPFRGQHAQGWQWFWAGIFPLKVGMPRGGLGEPSHPNSLLLGAGGKCVR